MQVPLFSPNPERRTQLAFSFAPPLLLQTAVELQVFDFLDQSPRSLEELAAQTGASIRGWRALLNALVGSEFLTRNDAVAIAEWLVNRTRTAPPHSLMFAVNMLVHSNEEDTFSFDEIGSWLSEVGFRDARLLDAPGVRRSSLPRRRNSHEFNSSFHRPRRPLRRPSFQ